MKDEAKHIANIITGIRIVCAIALLFCPTFSSWFYIPYILGGISDVFDGIVARHFGKETKFGARLHRNPYTQIFLCGMSVMKREADGA